MSAAVDAKKHRPAELRRYWPAVLACFATAVFAWGFGFSGMSVYLAELHRLHPWSLGLIGAAITTYYLVGAICMTLVHVVLRRAGPGRVLGAGSLLLGLGATLFSRSEQPWELFGAAVLMAVGWAGCTTTAIPSALAMYFERQLGLAITLALNGASAAGFTVGPILLILSQGIGVGNAVPLTALAALAIVLPLIGFGLREPSASGFSAAKPDSFAFGASGILRSWRFWSVALPFALALAAQVGLIVHLVSFLLPHVGGKGAAGALAATSLAAISGRLALATVNSINPSPVATRPRFLARLLADDRKKTTPMSTSTGATVEISNASTWVIKVLPRFAPSMTARAGARSIAPFAANEVAINPVAVLLWSTAVTASPARSA